MTFTDGDGFERQLGALADAKRERQRLRAQRAAADAEVERAVAQVEERRTALAEEQRDVAALERLSVTRVLSALKGSRDDDLDREVAEREAARFALAAAEARQTAALRDLQAVDDRLAGLGDLDSAWEKALDGRERWLQATGERDGERLAAISERRGEVEAELRECEEALAAAAAAAIQLDAAAGSLGSADGWSAYDTWFGGGMISSSIKHDRLDEAADQLRRADQVLQVLSRELADLGRAGLDTLQVGTWDRTFDVFFDNFFTDLSVRRRVKDAIDQVADARRRVGRITQEVGDRRAALATEAVDLQTERRRLLS